MANWDYDAEYHIGRIDGNFYVIDDKGNAMEGPFHRIEIAHVKYGGSDHLKAWGKEDMRLLSKQAEIDFDYPSNFSMEIKLR